jgi:hypothetical protein
MAIIVPGVDAVMLREPQATDDIVQRLRETEDRFKVRTPLR